MVEGGAGDVQDLGDRGLGDILAQQRPDVLLLAVEPGFSQGPLGPSEPRQLADQQAVPSNAALAWNTVQIGVLIDGLKARGEAVSRETLARVSPLVHRHIIPSGTYRFRDQRPRLE